MAENGEYFFPDDPSKNYEKALYASPGELKYQLGQ